MSKPTDQTSPAEHLRTVSPDQMDSVMGLIEQAEKELDDLGVTGASKADKAELDEAAAESGVPTSDQVAAKEAEMMEDLGFDTEFFLGEEMDVDDGEDINAESKAALPETPDPTTAVPNSTAAPAVDIDDFFGEDDDINE